MFKLQVFQCRNCKMSFHQPTCKGTCPRELCNQAVRQTLIQTNECVLQISYLVRGGDLPLPRVGIKVDKSIFFSPSRNTGSEDCPLKGIRPKKRSSSFPDIDIPLMNSGRFHLYTRIPELSLLNIILVHCWRKMVLLCTSSTAPLLFGGLKWPSITTFSREGGKWNLRTGTKFQHAVCLCCVLLS